MTAFDPKRETHKDHPTMLVNALSNWGPLGVNLIIGLLLTPYLIRYLGDSQYGVWTIVGSIIGYYGLLRANVGSGILRYVPYYAGNNNVKCVSEIIGTGLSFFLVTGMIILGISLLAADAIARFFEGGAEFAVLVRILGSAAAVECQMRILDSILRAYEKWISANLINMVTALLRVVGLVGCVEWDYGLVGMGYVILGENIISLALTILIVKKTCPQVRLNPFRAKWIHARTLFVFGVMTTVITFVYTMRFNWHNLIIGKYLSLEMVTIYFPAMMILNNVHRLVLAPTRVFWPRFAYLDGRNNHDELRYLYSQGTRLSAIFSSGVIALVFIAGPGFIRLWVGERFAEVNTALLILAGGYLVETCLTITGLLLMGTGHQKAQTVMALIEGAIGMGVSVVLVFSMGLAGVALGFLVSVVLMRLLVCPWYISRLYHIPLWGYYRDNLLRPWLIMMLLVAAAYAMDTGSIIHGWFSLIAVATVFGMLYLVFTYFLVLDGSSRKFLDRYSQKYLAWMMSPLPRSKKKTTVE